jgi:hypothetical protein
MGLGGYVDARPAGAVGVRVRCSGNGSLNWFVAREVGRRQARWKETVAEKRRADSVERARDAQAPPALLWRKADA